MKNSLLTGLILFCLSLFGTGGQLAAQTTANQQSFDTAEKAVEALLAACKDNDDQALISIFGQEHEDLVVTNDKQADRETRETFYQAAQESLELEADGDDRRVVVVGENQWPLPIPLVREDNGWRFDTEAGADEIINRRVGRNELEAIAMLQALVDAQLEYVDADHDSEQVFEYAQRIISSEGKRDGLYWKTEPGETPSPLGPYLNDAGDYLEGKKAGDPWHGYFFKVLTEQGDNAPGGAHSYIINGNMIAGFALMAFPAEYGSSGVMTLIVSHQGLVYEKDLGEDTQSTAAALKLYDPDDSWQPVKDDEAQ